jgi:hypothetical protein
MCGTFHALTDREFGSLMYLVNCHRYSALRDFLRLLFLSNLPSDYTSQGYSRRILKEGLLLKKIVNPTTNVFLPMIISVLMPSTVPLPSHFLSPKS